MTEIYLAEKRARGLSVVAATIAGKNIEAQRTQQKVNTSAYSTMVF